MPLLHGPTIYLDFHKAFDMVPREQLLFKVASLLIRGNLLFWIRCMYWRVCIGQACSEWVPVTSVVPKGSVLRPRLFLIYVPKITSRVSKSAYDTKLRKRLNKPELRLQLQEYLNKLAEWSDMWMMPSTTQSAQLYTWGATIATISTLWMVIRSHL